MKEKLTDITYIRTYEGWLYLEVQIDLYSRAVIGWSMKPTMATELAMDALKSVLHAKIYPTREEARSEIIEYIEVFYNRTRRHSYLNQPSPMAFEQLQTGS